jgi:dTDP-4-dehydrorhamnose reductase
MKAVVTGLNGTLAPILGQTLLKQDCQVVGWDRQQVPPEDESAMARFLDAEKPDCVYHLAMGTESWAGWLAEQCQLRGIGFLFTSTAMVFDHQPDGPHHVNDDRSAKDDYGRYKIKCEDAIRNASSDAIIARIGWQIGPQRGGNNLIEWLHKTMEDDGTINAGTRWIPATSFMDDTCEVLYPLMLDKQPGTYHLDSNAKSALTFFDLVNRLKTKRQENWVVQPSEDYVHDQRLLDERIEMPSIADRLSV